MLLMGPYVPVLRWKEAERKALHKLFHADREQISPLIGPLTPQANSKGRSKTVSELATDIPADIAECWGQRPIFFDAHLPRHDLNIGQEDSLLREVVSHGKQRGLTIIPVTGLSRPVAYQSAVVSAVALMGAGACVRLTPADILDATLPKKLQDLVVSLKQKEAVIDILVDFRSIFGVQTPNWSDVLARIPQLNEWRTLISASGAFPQDLTRTNGGEPMEPGEHDFPRSDWINWADHVKSGRLPRCPLFSDYTIQWALQQKPIQVPNISASIRYTCEDHWLVMRGEGMQKEGSAGAKQYPAHAKQLVRKKEFCGAAFSAGDAYIEEKSRENLQAIKKTGNARTWIEAGINHHLTFVARQVANRFSEKTSA
jgi:hypothetical protein